MRKAEGERGEVGPKEGCEVWGNWGRGRLATPAKETLKVDTGCGGGGGGAKGEQLVTNTIA